MNEETESMYTIFLEEKMSNNEILTKEELKKYFVDSNDMIKVYLNNKKKAWKKVSKQLGTKLIISRLKRDSKSDYLVEAIKLVNELNEKTIDRYNTLISYGESSLDRTLVDNLIIYNAYKKYCSSINDLSNKLAVDVLNIKSNRNALGYILDTEEKLKDIEDESEDLNGHVSQIVDHYKANKKSKRLVK